MRKVLVSDLARELGNSTASIYQKIERGTLKAEKINGKTYVFVENEALEKEFSSTSQDLLKIENEHLKELIKLKEKEIAELKESWEALIKSKDSEIATLKITFDTFTGLFSKQLTQTSEAEIISTGKKKKKKKKH